jgi:hypothetical protein
MSKDRVATIGDWLVVGLVGAAFVVDLTGGFRVGHGWYRLTVTDPTHILALAAIVALVRHLIVRHPSLREKFKSYRLAHFPSAGTAEGAKPGGLVLSSTTWRQIGIATAVMALATVVYLHDQVWMITGVPDRGDPLLSMWMLGWVAHQLTRNPLALFSGNMFYPAADTLAYSDATLLPSLISAPFLWAGVPLAVCYGGLYIGSFVLAGVAMFALVHALTGRMVPSLVAGLLFSFFPYRVSTYSHLQMQGVFLMPLAILFLVKAIERGRRRDGLLLGAMVAMQMLWSLYLGAYLAISVGVVTVGAWLTGHFLIRQRIGVFVAAILIGLAVVGPYTLPYWRTRAAVGDRPRDEVRSFSAQPVDYLDINEMNILYGKFMSPVGNAERQLFPGVAPILLTAVALVPPVAPVVALAGAGALVAFDASLGMNGAVFSGLYDHVPAFHAFRVPARFGMIVGLFLTLMAGVGLARLERRSSSSVVARIAYVALVGLSLFEVRPALQLAPLPTSAPGIYQHLAADPKAVIVDLPLPQDGSEYWIDPTYLYYSTFHWHPLLNGYSGFEPPWYSRLVVASRELPGDDAVAAFKAAGAQYIVLHESFCPPGRYQEIAGAFGQRADLTLVATDASAEGESRLYRFGR